VKEQSENNLGKKFDDFKHKATDGLYDKIQGAGAPVPGEFSNGFDGYTHIPQGSVWLRIEAILHPEKRRRAIFWWSSAAGLAILIGTGLFWNLNSRSEAVFGTSNAQLDENRLPAEQHELSENEFSPKNAENDGKTTLFDNNESFLEENSSFTPNDKKSKSSEKKKKTRLMEQSLLVEQSIEQDKISPPENRTGVPTELKLISMRAKCLLTIEINKDSLSEFHENPPALPKTRNWNPGGSLLAGNLSPSLSNGTVSSSSPTEIFYDNSGLSTPTGVFDPAAVSTMTANDPREEFASSTSNFGGNEEDLIPISAGLDFEYCLSQRLSILFGLQYTVLKSRTTLRDQNGAMRVDIKRNYLGIPLGLKFQFIQNRKFAAYSKASLISDLGLNQKENYNAIEGNYGGLSGDQTTTSYSRKIVRMQYGTSLGLGTNYSFANKWNVYGELAVCSYFYQSHYNTYSNQTLWPTFKLGISRSL
jgi:hypothetical protein